MKITFIQPNVGYKGHTWEALGIGYIISTLRKYIKEDLDINFYSGFYDSDKTILRGAEDSDIIGFGCTSPQFKHALDLSKKLRSENNWIVMGGIHPTCLPKDVIREKDVDIVIEGEGELSFYRIVRNILENRQSRNTIVNSRSIKNLDNLPYPDRDTIKNERNIQQAYNDGGKRITSIFSSRGCPFNCSFCCSRFLWGSKARIRSPINVLDEFEYTVNKWNIDFIKFADDTFTLNRGKVKEFCNEKIKRNINIPFGANAHVNTINRDLLEHLYKANCTELWYGVESGSPRILKDMNKHTNVDKIRDAFKLTKEYGIKTRAYFLLGMPNETIEDIKMTEELCDELEPDMVGFALLSPFPNNEYYDHDLMKDWDWSTFDEYNNNWVNTKTLSNEDLRYEQKRLIDKYRRYVVFRHKDKV